MRDFYQEVKDILGSQCAIVPIGDAQHENAAHTTVTTVGNGSGNGLAFTYSEARTAFDAPTIHLRNQHRQPRVPLNGSDEEADSPDAAFWTRGNGTVDSAFSLGAVVEINESASTRNLLSKWTGGNREWTFQIQGNDTLGLFLYDDAANVLVGRSADTAHATGRRVFLCATYDGGGGATAGDGIKVYTNGLVEPSSAINNASYVAMDNLTSQVKLADIGDGGQTWDGAMWGGPCGGFFTEKELSAGDVQNLNQVVQAAMREPGVVFKGRGR